MALTTGRYPSFLGGASQQDDSVRSPNQLSEAINTWLHTALGTGKRPPAEFVKVLADNLDPMAHYHSIVRDAFESYVVVIGNGTIRVFNHMTGYEYDVVPTGSALQYLATKLQPWSVFKTMTLADTTFIVNTERVVKMDAELSPGALTGSVQTFTDLPKPTGSIPVPMGVIYEIVGAAGNEFDNYYVQRAGAGVWLEVARPGIQHKFDRNTMPHLLKRIPDPIHGDGFYFSFGAPEWEGRLAGDASTNISASFVGEKIVDVFHHRSRVGFLSTENCAMSEVDRPFNFWRTSVTQLLDSDPVDFAVNTDGVASLRHAISYESSLILFGDRANFQMTADPFLTPKTPKVDPLVNYECSRYVKPEKLGDTLYSVTDAAAFTILREYFMDDVSITGDAADVTSHVPRYIPGRVRAMAGAPEADVVVLAQESAPHQLYAYFVRWAGTDKVQSAWCKWDIAGVGRVVHLKVIDGYLYVLARKLGSATGVEMLRMSLSLATEDSDFTEDYSFMLDRLAVLQPTHYPFGNYTDVNLPYAFGSMTNVVVAKTDDWADAGTLVDLQGATLADGGMALRFPGNLAAGKLAVGLNYVTRADLTRPYLRDRNNEAITVGRLQVRDITVAYKDAAYFEVEVATRGRTTDPQTYLASHAGLFTARTLNDSTFRLNAPLFHSGEQRFPVQSRSDQVRISLVNRLPYQCWWQSAQYRALFSSRSQV